MQAQLEGVEEAEIPLHLQGVPRHLPLDQERVWNGFQIEKIIQTQLARKLTVLSIQYFKNFVKNVNFHLKWTPKNPNFHHPL